MKTERTTIIFSVLIAVVLTMPALSMAQQLSVAERVAALKATVASSQAKLRQYQWIQNTVVSVNGEVKYRNQERCYYGADGNIAKVILNQTAPPPDRRGLIGRIEEKKRGKPDSPICPAGSSKASGSKGFRQCVNPTA